MGKPCNIHNRKVVDKFLGEEASRVASSFRSKLEFTRYKNHTDITLRSATNSNLFNAKNGISQLKELVVDFFGDLDMSIQSRKDKSSSMQVRFNEKTFDKLSEAAREPSRLEFYKGDLALLAQEERDYRFFQKSSDGRKRNLKLEQELQSILTDNGVRVIDLESYKQEATSRGEEFETDSVALADIINKVIAVAWEEAGKDTLPEEAGHFLEAFVKQNMPDSWTVLTNDEFLSKTEEYKKHFKQSISDYNGDTLRAKREIVGKILGRALTEEYYSRRYESLPPFFRHIARAVRKFLKYFRNKRKDAVTRSVESVYGDLAIDFFDGRFDFSSLDGKSIRRSEIKSSITDIAHQTLVNLANRIKTLKKRREGLRGKVIKRRYEELSKKHNIEALEETIREIETMTYINDEQAGILNELYELLNLRDSDRIDKQNVEKLKTLTIQINRLTNQLQRKQEVQGIETFILGLQVTREIDENTVVTEREGGLDQDLIIIKNVIDNIREGKRSLTKDLFNELMQFSEYYTEILSKLNGMVESGIEIEGLSNPVMFKNSVKRNISDLNDLNDFLDVNFNDVVKSHLTQANLDSKGNPIDPNLNVDEVVKDRQYFDRSHFRRYFGSLQHATDPILGFIFELQAKVKNKVEEHTRSKGVELYSKSQPLIQELERDQEFMNVLREMGYNNVEETLIEKQDASNFTPYLINKYRLGGENGFNKALEDAAERIIVETEAYARTLGREIHIPRGIENRSERNAFFLGEDLFLSSEPENLPKELTTRDKINTFYRTQWRDWFRENTQQLKIANLEQRLREEDTTEKERDGKSVDDFIAQELASSSGAVNYIIRKRKRELTELEFKEWSSRNIQRGYHGDTYYTGELATPASHFVNGAFNSFMRNESWLKLWLLYNSNLMEAKRKIPDYITNDYSARYLMPQISEDLLGILKQNKSTVFRGKFKQAYEQFTNSTADIFKGSVMARSDDELYANATDLKKGDGTMFKSPPVRFIRKLNDPNLISKDVFFSLIMFHDMAENYHQLAENLDEYELYAQTVRRRTYKHKVRSKFNIFSNTSLDEDIKGEESVAYKNVKDFLDTYVYGDQNEASLIFNGMDINKVSNKFFEWAGRKNLQANFPAIVTGFLMASKETTTETIIGKYINPESTKFAAAELTKNSGQVFMELGSPLKKNKISLLLQKTHLLSNNIEVFKNQDKSRILRLIVNSINFGLWKIADYFPKAHALIAIADNYRYIDNTWYNKDKFIRSGGTNQQWKAAKANSFYNLLTVVNNDLSADERIGEDEWNYIINNAKRLSSYLDTQPTDLDRAAIGRKWWGKILTLHRGWLWMGIEKRWKAPHFNRYTQTEESGIYWDIFQYGKKNPGSFLFNFFTPTTIVDYFRQQTNRESSLSPLERESLMRLKLDIIWMYAFYSMMYLVHAAVYGDDDNKDSPFMQFMAYVSTRLVLEQAAFLSPRELYDFFSRPVAGLDLYDSLTRLATNLAELLMMGKEQETISKGTYEGKTDIEKTLIKITPIVRGYYETVPADLPFSNSAEGLRGKNQYIRNQVLGEISIVDPLLYPAHKAFGEVDGSYSD